MEEKKLGNKIMGHIFSLLHDFFRVGQQLGARALNWVKNKSLNCCNDPERMKSYYFYLRFNFKDQGNLITCLKAAVREV